jgi:hypothetical protein
VKSSTAKEAKGRICRHQASLNTSAIKNHPTVIGSRLRASTVGADCWGVVSAGLASWTIRRLHVEAA